MTIKIGLAVISQSETLISYTYNHRRSYGAFRVASRQQGSRVTIKRVLKGAHG